MVGGHVAEGGDANRTIDRVAPLHRAGDDELTFLANAKYAEEFSRTRAAIALVAPALAGSPGADGTVRVIVDRPHEALLALLPKLYTAAPREPGVHPTAKLGRGVQLGDDVTIGAYAVVGEGAVIGDRAWVDSQCVVGAGVAIGEDAHVYPHVTLYSGTTLGARVLVHSGARIGSDGFGYVFADGGHQKIPHVGRCVIGDDVEIGANSTIDRGSIDDTLVGAGTKIDNLVHVGHNVHIGRLCLVMAQVGIAGSAVIEDGAVLAGQVGVGGHVTIGARSQVAGQAGVFGDLAAGGTYSGYPARPHKEALRATAATFRIAGLMKRIERLLADAPMGEKQR